MLTLTDHASVREIRMDRPPVNALNGPLLDALREAFEAAFESAEAVVLSGRPGLFSAGLDVPELLQLDRDGMSRLWRSFMGLLRTLGSSPVPVAAAITGHSPAGGAVLSVFCDYRVMARGPFRIGLNETQVGLVVPAPIRKAMARLTGPHRAERLLVAGNLLDPDAALEAGIVDALSASPESVVTDAVAWCESLLALPRRAMLRNRELSRAEIRAWFDQPEDLGAIVQDWFAGETQKVLHALVDNLKKKSG